MRVTLASASPRRKELIKKIPDLEVDIVVSGEEENVCESVPALLTQKLALVKAKSVFGKVGGVVIGADTVVCVDGRILGKPKTAEEARSAEERRRVSISAKRSLSILTRQSLRVYTFQQKRKFWRIYEKVFSFFVNFPRDDFIMQ